MKKNACNMFSNRLQCNRKLTKRERKESRNGKTYSETNQSRNEYVARKNGRISRDLHTFL